MKDQVALVIGATSDIGTAIAAALLDAGAKVLLQGRNPTRLDALGTRLRGSSERIAADLTRHEDVERLHAIVRAHGRLDTLILGAGIYERSADPDALSRQFASNVQGPYSLLCGLIAQLVSSQGQIVFLNSTQGLSASKGVGQYAATQHALRAIADSLRDELNPQGVRVLSIFLGRTATERQRDIFAFEGRAYHPERLMQPADVAHVVLAALSVPKTAEITNIVLRPMLKHD